MTEKSGKFKLGRWRPKARQKFWAYLKVERPDRLHRGSPFVCIEPYAWAIEAKDKNGLICSLKVTDYYFLPKLKNERQNQG